MDQNNPATDEKPKTEGETEGENETPSTDSVTPTPEGDQKEADVQAMAADGTDEEPKQEEEPTA